MRPERKTCKTCSISLPIEHFPIQRDQRRGKEYRRAHCAECWKKQPHKRPDYRQAERARSAARQGKRYTATGRKGNPYRRQKTVRELQVMLCLEAHRAHRDYLRTTATNEEVADWYAERPWANPRLSPADRYRLRYNFDIEFNIREKLRTMFRKRGELARFGETVRVALRNQENSPVLERLLGYTLTDLRLHIEQKFTDGMSWEAFARGDIHIDHVRPRASYDPRDPEQWRECWSIRNLQPLWARDNLTKGARWGGRV